MTTTDPYITGLRASIHEALLAGNMDSYRDLSLIYADALEDADLPIAALRRRRKAITLRPPGVLWPHAALIPGLSTHQAEEVGKSLSRPVGILTGTPGTGKTYCAGLILAEVVSTQGSDIAACAPTGKAAVRLTSALLGAGLQLRATTIHQLLEIGRNGHDGEGWGFRRNATNPLRQRFVLVDESSMLDTGLFACLLAALRPGTHLLLVGDPHQLPPVGHGAPLRDMIAAGVPCGKLSEIRRNDGLIVRACAAIKDGKKFATVAPKDFGPGPDCNLVMVHANTPDEQAEKLVRVLEALPVEVPPQVICALNGGSAIGRKDLNASLQALINGEPQHGEYMVEDKVICLKNGPYPVVDGDRNQDTAYVANGEMGVCIDVQRGYCLVRFQDPPRLVRVYASQATEGGDDGARDAGAEVVAERQNFALGYAITGHKSQGSEWPVVVVMLDGSRGAERVCSREWLYTAISRASQLCVLIGSQSTIDGMLRRTELAKRRTRLTSLLRESLREKA